VKSFCEAQLVTYERRCKGYGFLDDILEDSDQNDALFIVHWGPDVPSLVRRLRGRNVVYHAHSCRYGFSLPVDVPIITVSKHSMAYWGREAACSVIYQVPNVIADRYTNWHSVRDIDVLVQKRKSSKYLLKDLVPALEGSLRVTVMDDWVDDMVVQYNRSKVYLYDSTDYWRNRGVSEGFGLPPLEALACGCSVFSSVNDGLSDYLRPGVNAEKIRCASLDFDVKRICRAVRIWKDELEEPSFLEEYRAGEVTEVWKNVMTKLNTFFDARPSFGKLIDPSDRHKKPSVIGYSIWRARNRLLSRIKWMIHKK
jgi:hypothetical protein